MSDSKMNLLNDYLNGYTAENRLAFCEMSLRKYRFENYKLSDNYIHEEDLIVGDSDTRSSIESIINKGECSVDDFKNVFNLLTEEQIVYIGY